MAYLIPLTDTVISSTLVSIHNILEGSWKLPAAAIPEGVGGGDALFTKIIPGTGITVNAGEVPSAVSTSYFEVVWLSSAAAFSHTYEPPTTDETPVPGRFVACLYNAVAGVGGDTAYIAAGYYAKWPGCETFCTPSGLPLAGRQYLCTATGHRYVVADGTDLGCIAAPPADAKKSLFVDLWNECGWESELVDGTWRRTTYYDPDADTFYCNDLPLSYGEAVQVYGAGIPRNNLDRFFMNQAKIRTNIRPMATFIDATWMFYSCSMLEVANVNNIFKGTLAFAYCPKLHTVRGIVNRPEGELATGSPLLADIQIKLDMWADTDFSLATNPAISEDSIQWMIDNSSPCYNGEPRTCTLHPSVYDQLSETQIAAAAAVGITFISA